MLFLSIFFLPEAMSAPPSFFADMAVSWSGIILLARVGCAAVIVMIFDLFPS